MRILNDKTIYIFSFYSTTQQLVNVKNPKYIEFDLRLQWLVFQMLLSLTLHALKQQVIFVTF